MIREFVLGFCSALHREMYTSSGTLTLHVNLVSYGESPGNEDNFMEMLLYIIFYSHCFSVAALILRLYLEWILSCSFFLVAAWRSV